MKRRTDGPQLLERLDVVAEGAGWWLPQCGREWTPVAEHPPGPGTGERCWWLPTAPPKDGFRTPRETR